MNTINLGKAAPAVREITLRVSGKLDLEVGLSLGEVAEASGGLQKPYVLDLEDATVFDSGLAWILMFKRRVENMGGSLNLFGVTPDLQRRFARLGIAAPTLVTY